MNFWAYFRQFPTTGRSSRFGGATRVVRWSWQWSDRRRFWWKMTIREIKGKWTFQTCVTKTSDSSFVTIKARPPTAVRRRPSTISKEGPRKRQPPFKHLSFGIRRPCLLNQAPAHLDWLWRLLSFLMYLEVCVLLGRYASSVGLDPRVEGKVSTRNVGNYQPTPNLKSRRCGSIFWRV